MAMRRGVHYMGRVDPRYFVAEGPQRGLLTPAMRRINAPGTMRIKRSGSLFPMRNMSGVQNLQPLVPIQAPKFATTSGDGTNWRGYSGRSYPV